MALTDGIQSAVKSDKAVIGYNKSINYIKVKIPKMVIVANNLPASVKQELEHNAKVSKIKLETFDGTSRELGIACGKPFPVTTIIIE